MVGTPVCLDGKYGFLFIYSAFIILSSTHLINTRRAFQGPGKRGNQRTHNGTAGRSVHEPLPEFAGCPAPVQLQGLSMWSQCNPEPPELITWHGAVPRNSSPTSTTTSLTQKAAKCTKVSAEPPAWKVEAASQARRGFEAERLR